MAGRQFYFCDSQGNLRFTIAVADDASELLTAMGKKAASAFTASAQAELTASGVDVDGDVTIKARYGGTWGNNKSYEQVTGPTGGGNEDLSLRVDVDGDTVSVKFATDGSGNSVTPTAQQVHDLINADDSLPIVAELPGDGTSAVATSAATALSGGTDNGTCYKITAPTPQCIRVAGLEVT